MKFKMGFDFLFFINHKNKLKECKKWVVKIEEEIINRKKVRK